MGSELATPVLLLTLFMLAMSSLMLLVASYHMLKRARGERVIDNLGNETPWQIDVMLLTLGGAIFASSLPVLISRDPFWLFGVVHRLIG